MTTFAPSAVNHPIQPDNLKTTSLHNIDELTWLIVSNNIQPTIITLNETNKVYQILLNTVSKYYQSKTVVIKNESCLF